MSSTHGAGSPAAAGPGTTLACLPGQLLAARFRLLRLLGTGGTGRVWLAEDVTTGDPVALKFLDRLAEADGGVAARAALARHEVACMQRVTHPNVARALGVWEHDGEPFLAVQAVLGGGRGAGPGAGADPRSLASLRGAPPGDWIGPVLQLADALAAVHAAGVVHRDVKAANVLIDRAGNALLVDFGVASASDGEAGGGVLHTGGSPLAMSPQQRAGEAPVPADDVYAFGVLLHELWCGRAATGPGPVNAGELPGGEQLPRLAGLLSACLARDAQERPAGMAVVRDRLAALATEELNATQAPASAADLRAAEQVRATPRRAAAAVGTAGAGAAPARGTTRAVPWRLLAAVSGVWLLVLAGVLLTRFEPRVAVPPVAATDGAEADAASGVAPADAAGDATGAPGGGARSASGPAVAAPLAFARLRRERSNMMGDVDRVLDLQNDLEARAVERWAPTRFEEAVAAAERGDEFFQANDFASAREAYGEAQTLLEALAAEAGEAAAQAVAEGWAAYEAGRGEAAAASFELALAIDAQNEEAAQGLARARVLDEVLALREEAQALVRGGALREAAQRYEQLLALDDARADARDALARLRQRLDRSAFDMRMSEGFAALEAKDFDAARRAFEAARRLDPDAAAVSDALAQVGVEERAQRLAALGREAAALAEAERWREAAAVYEQALAIDASLRFARSGLAQARRMEELYERLSFYADDPLRLTDASVRQRAQAVLAQAQQATPRGPELESRQARLAELLEASARPVSVPFVSDGRTEVRILRVADLGTFQRRELALRPGRYTAVGTREGYRDVREEFVVPPGAEPPLVEIRCVEKI